MAPMPDGEGGTVALIHTVAGLAPVFNSLVRDALPTTRAVHIVDEDLLQDTIRNGVIRDETRARLRDYVTFAEKSGARAVMVTCSSVGPAVDEIAAHAALPVLRVDAAMADEAVRKGRRIGVLGTLGTTLEPTAALIRTRAGDNAEITVRLAEGAFEALQRGDTDEHDRRVLTALHELLESSDVIVLAQASMARVVDQLPEQERRVPILTSPRLGVERLAEVAGAARR
jgi:Asp/Glu/hydantoin racemase